MGFSRQFFKAVAVSILLCANTFAQNSSTELKPACLRIEGTNMSCAGAGIACEETCEKTFGSKIEQSCSGAIVGTICNAISPTPCYGVKCCDGCEAHQNEFCGTFDVCGKSCTIREIDCSKKNCAVPVLGTGVAKWTQVVVECTPGIVCDTPIKAGDGCVCNCSVSGQSCTGQDNGRCAKCECGGYREVCTPTKYKMVCTNDFTVQCLLQYNSVPMVNDGPCTCKCPVPPIENLPSCRACS